MKMVKKSLLSSLVVGSLILTQTAFASVSGNFTLTSDYMWRGQTQTGHGPAVQGGLEYGHESGFTAGTWFSNVGSQAKIEVENDIYAKYTHTVNDDLNFGVGVTWYNYPRKLLEGSRNFSEYALFAGYKMLTFSINYTEEYLHIKSNSMYYALSGNFDLPMDLALGLTLGHTKHDKELLVGSTSHSHYLLSLSKSHEGTTVSVNYSNTDRKSKDATTGVEQKCGQDISVCDRTYFVSVGKTF